MKSLLFFILVLLGLQTSVCAMGSNQSKPQELGTEESQKEIKAIEEDAKLDQNLGATSGDPASSAKKTASKSQKYSDVEQDFSDPFQPRQGFNQDSPITSRDQRQ